MVGLTHVVKLSKASITSVDIETKNKFFYELLYLYEYLCVDIYELTFR